MLYQQKFYTLSWDWAINIILIIHMLMRIWMEHGQSYSQFQIEIEYCQFNNVLFCRQVFELIPFYFGLITKNCAAFPATKYFPVQVLERVFSQDICRYDIAIFVKNEIKQWVRMINISW